MRLINTIILVFASMGLLVLWGVFLAYYGRVPAIIPTHFGIGGAPNAWGHKSMLLLFPLLGLAAYAMAILFHYLVLPARRQMAPLVQTLVFFLLAELVWFWFFLLWETIRVGLRITPGLDNGFNIPFATIMLTVVALLIAAVSTRSFNTLR